MMHGLQMDMMQMHRDLSTMSRQMQNAASNMRQEMQQSANSMRRDAMRMQSDMQRNARRMHHDMQRNAQQMRLDARRSQEQILRNTGQLHRRAEDPWPDAAPSNVVSTSVVNGIVYVNSHEVARVPTGQGVRVQNLNGTVVVNGQQVWPAGAPAAAAPAVPHALKQAFDCSLASVCDTDLTEPCPICIAPIQAGQHTRTLPCFHIFHRSCAEGAFQASLTAAGDILCPVCRVPITPAVLATDAN